jgi:hypothetical protein
MRAEHHLPPGRIYRSVSFDNDPAVEVSSFQHLHKHGEIDQPSTVVSLENWDVTHLIWFQSIRDECLLGPLPGSVLRIRPKEVSEARFRSTDKLFSSCSTPHACSSAKHADTLHRCSTVSPVLSALSRRD